MVAIARVAAGDGCFDAVEFAAKLAPGQEFSQLGNAIQICHHQRLWAIKTGSGSRAALQGAGLHLMDTRPYYRRLTARAIYLRSWELSVTS